MPDSINAVTRERERESGNTVTNKRETYCMFHSHTKLFIITWWTCEFRKLCYCIL